LRFLQARRIWALARKPFDSLPSRMVISVFATVLVTSLVVTWISTRSIASFLRAEIDQKFPTILRTVNARLDGWYSQREIDLETFSRSATVVASLSQIRDSQAASRRAQQELSKYLAYVLERFPQFEALFVLDVDARPLLRVGEGVELSGSRLQRLAAAHSARVGDVILVGGSRVQVASAPVRDVAGRRLATLHALVRVDAVEEVLRSEDLGPASGIYAVGADGEILLRSPEAGRRTRYGRPLPSSDAVPGVEEYALEDGTRVVGSSLRFPRFGWTLVVEEVYEEAFAPVVAVVGEMLGINLCIVLIFGMIAYQMARSLVRPIRALSAASLRIAAGDTDVEIPGPTPQDEIGVLISAFNDMSSRLRANRQALEASRLEIEQANEKLLEQNRKLQQNSEIFQQLSITDELTRLHNHRFFQDQLPREAKRADRTGQPLCLILIDLDDFKKLNDRFGHAVGDSVLRRVAALMNQTVRETDLLARYGGEEFALLVSGAQLEDAVAIAEKVRLAISDARFSLLDPDGKQRISITASFGVALYQGDEKAFFNDADRALYAAKAAGKDCVRTAESG
jgi:diguanylate cyclase (GGDEF)-like protein